MATTRKRVTIKAKFTPLPKKHTGASQPKTPLSGCGSLMALRNGELQEVICVRTYFNERGTGMQPVRACIWITPAVDSGEQHRSGYGSASGCGYHKESAAIADALADAGIDLYGNAYLYGEAKPDFKKRVHFGGTGSSAYAEIFKAVARAAGYKGRMAWVSHGL